MPFSFEVAPKVLENPRSALIGFCDVLIDGKILLSGFKIFEKEGRRWVGNPSQAGKPDDTGKTPYFDTVRFIDTKEKEEDWTTPFQAEVYEAILAAFDAASGTAQTQSQSSSTVAPAGGGPARAKRPGSNPLWKR